MGGRGHVSLVCPSYFVTALFFNFLFSLIAGFKNANYLYEKPMYFSACAMK